MHAIAFVFVLLLGAAGLWYGGRALFGPHRDRAWLSRAVDQRGRLLMALAGLLILGLVVLGLSALVLVLSR